MKRLQNRIAESRFALPVTAVYALSVWLAGGLVEHQRYLEFVIFAFAAYLMVELNNRNSLIRIYSRMVSCSFIVLATMNEPMFDTGDVWLTLLCFVAMFIALFNSYQDKRAQGRVFYAFMFIGIASLLHVQVLFFVPVVWMLMASCLMAFSNRNFWASVIGLTVPYWFFAGYSAITGQLDYFFAHFSADAWISQPFLYEGLDVCDIAAAGCVALVAFIGMVHFLRNSYKDKIRTRMIYETLSTMAIVCMVFIMAQPQHIAWLTGIMTIPASVLIAHFFALTATRITNITFIVLTLGFVALTVANMLFR